MQHHEKTEYLTGQCLPSALHFLRAVGCATPDPFTLVLAAWEGERVARFEHEQFMVSDPWDSSLAKWLGHGGRDVDTPFTVADALEFGIGLDMQHAKPADQMRLIKILKRFGYRTPGYPEKMNERQARFWRKKT